MINRLTSVKFNHLGGFKSSDQIPFQVIFKHDTGRVVQSCVKYGTAVQRRKLFTQFKGTKWQCFTPSFSYQSISGILWPLIKLRVVQYWRLVLTRKADLCIRTSRTNRLVYSRVVVDPCISLETLRIFFGTENLRGLRYGLSTRTSRTGRVMYSRVVVDPCISFNRDTCTCVVLSRTTNTHSPLCISRIVLSRTRNTHSSMCIYTVSNDLQRLVNTLHDPYDSYKLTGAGTLWWTECVMYDHNDLVVMHGLTKAHEYIRQFVWLVQMDKSALRVDTSRQYWTFLIKLAGLTCLLSSGKWNLIAWSEKFEFNWAQRKKFIS